ncbi:MAG: right-handed parallel beta-helix repeat-containing protein [Bacteroidales bacterium]|nr:right-handed parallel beta-helix repeat-containing protein [Bacteroidales bacterium]
MKKLFYTATLVALSILAASCQRENLEPLDAQVVTYTVQLPDAIGTKASGDGMTLHYEVYRTDEEEATDFTTGATLLYHKEEAFENGVVNLNLELVNNQNFTVLFWAQTNGNDAFDCDDLTNVTISTDLKANQENYAVFSGHDFIESGEQLTGREIKLERPVAQLNIATTAASLESFNSIVTIDKSSVTLTGKLATSYNVATLTAGTAADVEFTYSAQEAPSGEFKTDYPYVAMNYVAFVDADGENVKVDYTIKTSVGDITNTIGNVPLKPNYRTNILGNLITETSDYEVSLEADWGGAAEEVEVITDGLVKINGVYNVSNANGLAYASQNLFAKEGGSYVLTEDIDMTGASSVVTKAAGLTYNSAALTHMMTSGQSFEFDGAGHVIKNLPGMFIAYTGSAKSVVVKNLTLETPNVAYNVNDDPDANGNKTDAVGAFIGYAGTSTTITLENCHVKGGKIEGGHWTGGFVGYAAGWSGNGPVFETLTIKDCSVKNAEITGKGSCGGIIGHATGDPWTLVDMDNIAVAFNKIISTGSSDNKAGSVMGTLGTAGQPTTVNGVTKTGGVTIDSYEASVNDVKSNNVVNTKLWGRQGNSDGVLTINGEKVTDFNAGVATTDAVTVSNDEELAKAIAGATGDMVIKLASGTYSSDINLTVAEYGGAKGDLVFKAVEGAEPVIAGTVTLGLYEKQTTNVAKWKGNVTFEGITFDHAEAANHSFSVQNVGTDDKSVALTLKNCKIIGDGEYGIGANSGCIAYNSSIIGCTFENAAMQITGNFGTGLVIDGCTFNESRINVQGGNGVTVQNCNFTNTLTDAYLNKDFYLIRSNAIPMTVKECNIVIDSELSDVATDQDKWAILWKRKADAKWNVSDVNIQMTDTAIEQQSLMVIKDEGTDNFNLNNITLNDKAFASTAASLTYAVNSGATDIYVEGNFKMPTSGTSNAITINSWNGKATIDNTLGSYWDGATLTFNNVNFKTSTGYANGNGSDYAALYSKNVTYNKCNFSGPMRLGRDGAKFIDCTFNDLGNDYVCTYGNAASFTGCTFNSAGKALLIYSDGNGSGKSPAVTVTGCTFNATQAGYAAAISNQSCAAIEIDNYGCGVTLTTSENTVDSDFSGEWRIKTYYTGKGNAVSANGTEYTTLALDGRTMTIEGTVVTVQY